MIVVCPSCGTPYRHRSADGATARTGRCSRCDGTFALSTRPSYRVEDPSPAPFPTAAPEPGTLAPAAPPRPAAAPVPRRRAENLGFGVDDPALLASLGSTALNAPAGGGRPAMTYWVVAEDSAGGRPKIEPAGDAPAVPARAETAPRADEPFGDALLERSAVSLRAASAVVLGAAGAAAVALAVSTFTGGPVRAPAIGGASFGALLGWGLTRWKVRES